MSVENPESAEANDGELKPLNGEQRMNGVSNGHGHSNAGGGGDKHRSGHNHKSSSKDKHRDRDRDRDKERTHKSSKSSSSGGRERDKDNKHSSSSGSKEKSRHSSSSHKSSTHDKHRSDRDKDRSRDKHRSSKDDKSHSSGGGGGVSAGLIRESEKMSSSSKQKESDGGVESKSREHKDRTGDKDGGTPKITSSTSSKDKHSSGGGHSSSSASKHREKSRSEHHHNSSSSSNRDKDGNRHRHRDSDRDRKDRKHTSGSSDHHHREEKENNIKKEQKHNVITNTHTNINTTINHDIKIENNYDGKKPNDAHNFSKISDNELQIKEEDNHINVSQASSCDYSLSQFRDDEQPFVVKAEQSEYSQYRPDEEEEEEDIPLAKRKLSAMACNNDDEDDVPLTARKKIKTEKKVKKKKASQQLDEDEDEKPKKKKIKKEIKQEVQRSESIISPQTKVRKKKEDQQPAEVWKWWEEEKREDGVKWNYLEHKGPVFAPDYEPLPKNVIFEYDGKPMRLSEDAEEIACFYGKMLDHDYTSKKIFNDNFFKDWRRAMTSKEREIITNLSKCNFKHIHAHFAIVSEKNKSRTKEEKLKIKLENEQTIAEYGFCTIDGHKEKIGNFKIEPPGLFRGRGEHPKMGMVKRRVMPQDVLINCSKNSKIPVAPNGKKWKEVRHDNSVTWLASWTENVQGQVKYVMLNPSSKLKGEKDWQKYETARRLHKHIDKIRNTYRDEWKSKEMRIRQRAVALYFIDKLALRAGNEKDEDQADTVGCCSLRVEHIQLHKEHNGKENVVVFDFLGKDSIRYYNEVEVEKRVFKNLEIFKENKKEGDDLFDRLNTVVLNEHLRELMEGLTAKVFRTYNASWTLQNQLDQITDGDATVPEKLLSYNRANRAVAILCNHQRAVPKSHSKSMANLKEKIDTKRQQVEDAEYEVKDLQKAARRGSVKEKLLFDKKKKQLEKHKEQLQKLELQETDRDENKTIALGTSKLNYLDPRISVAWCKKYNVPIEKIFNKTQRDKFRWAIDMAGADYRF